MGLFRVTTLIKPADTYDLIDLETVKDELNITTEDHDAWLERAITQVSSGMSRYCNRSAAVTDEASFPIERVSDLFYPDRDAYPYQVPGGVQPLQLSHWPIAGLIYAKNATAAASGDTVLTLADASKIAAGQPVGAAYSSPPSVPPAAGPEVIQPGTTVEGVDGNNITLTLPLTGALPSGIPITFGMSVVQTDPPGNDKLLAERIDFVVDAPRGQLIRLDQFTQYPTIWPALKVVVTYSGGFAAIPDDVQTAALRWIAWRWAERDRDPTVRSIEQPELGVQTFWVGGPPSTGGVPTEILALLDRYRVPVTA